jgi:hypothetical protein
MTTLILAGRTIVAAASSVETLPDRYRADAVDYPFSANITGTVIVGSLPGDFRVDRYEWDGTELVRLPDPPPSQAAIDAVTEARRAAYAAESDHLAIAWQAAVATDSADQDARKAAWLAARAAVQARLPYPT